MRNYTLANRILKDCKRDSGLSIDKNYNKPKSGYMVATSKNNCKVMSLKAYSDEQIEGVIDIYLKKLHARPENNIFLGLWIHLNKIYIELSYRYDSKKVAIELAKDFEQLAIYDVKNNCEIKTK